MPRLFDLEDLPYKKKIKASVQINLEISGISIEEIEDIITDFLADKIYEFNDEHQETTIRNWDIEEIEED